MTLAQVSTSCKTTKIGNPNGSEPPLPQDCQGGGSGSPGNEGPKPPNYPSDLRQAIIDKFGITCNGFDDQHLKWIWEKLWDTSWTKWNDLVKGAIVQAKPPPGSKRIGCPPSITVMLSTYSDETLFKYLLTHELSHSISGCKDRATVRWNESVNAWNAEGGVTPYGANAEQCTGSDHYGEDYAESLAMFLNPKAGVNAAPNCGGTPQNPYFPLPAKKPLHYNNVALPLLKGS